MRENTSGGTGGCLCGAVRYRYEGEPTAVGLCQCERCQRQSGSAFLIGVVFPKKAVAIEGRLARYETSASGNFIFFEGESVPGVKGQIEIQYCPEGLTCGT